MDALETAKENIINFYRDGYLEDYTGEVTPSIKIFCIHDLRKKPFYNLHLFRGSVLTDTLVYNYETLDRAREVSQNWREDIQRGLFYSKHYDVDPTRYE